MAETTRQIRIPQGIIDHRSYGLESSRYAPVVFVHGFLVDGTLWTRVAEHLGKAGIRSFAPDWPLGSHRRPIGPGADRTPLGVARMLIAWLDAYEFDDVTLVGNDSGGAICQFAVDLDPSRIGRLVLTNCDAFEA